MNAQLTVGSLFSGIGGFDLGLERAGMRTVWFCEQDKFCRRVLAKHWTGVPCYDDVCSLVADTRRERVPTDGGHRSLEGATGSHEGEAHQRQRVWNATGDGGTTGRMSVPVPYVDVLCGGFPCQDLSYAGKGAGLNGTRSGLWAEYARLIGELRPRYVIVENVAALLARGLSRVLGDLAALGYDAEWDCIPASAVGAPHRRDRLWLVAYPNSDGSQGRRLPVSKRPQEPWAGNTCDMANASNVGHERAGPAWGRWAGSKNGCGGTSDGHWLVEPDVGRVANGVSRRVDRLRSLGNALVPQIAELIGRRILAYEEAA